GVKIRTEGPRSPQILEGIEASLDLFAVQEIPIPDVRRLVASRADRQPIGQRTVERRYRAALGLGNRVERPLTTAVAVKVAIGDEGLALDGHGSAGAQHLEPQVAGVG